MHLLFFFLPLCLFSSLVSAYSFNITSTPAQCQTLSIAIDGEGQAPYTITIIPSGPSPLSGNIEARRIFSKNIENTTGSFLLPYPADSQFVAVMSDTSGFGTGGTSTAVTVQTSDDASCYNTTQSVSPAFVFNISPVNALVQCSATRIYWDNTTVVGRPTFQGVIPGGQSFAVPQGNLTTVANEGLGFNWTPSVRGGTFVVLIGGDDRGIGTAGSASYSVGAGTSNNCLNEQSPSSTPGAPAGGTYPTSTSTSTSSPSSAVSHTNKGAIAGGVVGGIIGLGLLIALLFFIRRNKRHQQTQKEQPVDLLQDTDHDNADDGRLPEYYQPEPFMLPDPTAASSANGSDEGHGLMPPSNRFSRSGSTSVTDDGGLRPSTPDTSVLSSSTYMRKSPAPPSFRPVNIIQHDDAGPSEGPMPEPETIELPPAYTNIPRRGSPPPMDPDDDEAGPSVRPNSLSHT